MQMPMPSLTLGLLRAHLTWRRILLGGLFIFVLLMTMYVADVVLNVWFPDVRADPATVNAIMADLLAEPSLPENVDLERLGFIPDKPGSALKAALIVGDEESDDLLEADDLAELDEGGDLGIAGVLPPIATATATGTATATPVPSATATPTILPSWDRKGRVNILLMGLDGGANAGRFRRADTLIVASLDPESNTAVMLSLPRDLYVTIHAGKTTLRNRINTAYVWGEYYKYPGGGPALQMRTVSEVLGIPIHHYVSVNIYGFEKLIDAIGGIDIDVPYTLRDNFTHWTFNKGMQHMDGATALKYARSRYSTSDFSRARRQQLVLMAARDKVLKANMLPKLPTLLPTLAGMFQTDLSVRDLLALAGLVAKLDTANVKMTLVDETMVSGYTTSGGARVLMPRWDRINALVKSTFAAQPSPTPVLTAVGAPATAVAGATKPVTAGAAAPTATRAAAVTAAPTAPAPAVATPLPSLTVPAYLGEQATIEVLNGTYTIGLAKRTKESLEKRGLSVVRIGDAVGTYRATVLYDDGTKPATRAYLIELLKIRPENIRALAKGGPNIRIILGTDVKVP